MTGSPSAPPLPPERAPRLRCPAGATDCHVHLYGPADAYPMRSGAPAVPDALPERLRRMLASLGVDRAVLVQPTQYGDINDRQLDGVADLGMPVRVVASQPADVGMGRLRALHAKGVRGLRITLKRREDVEKAAALAPLVADLGWHLDLFIPPGLPQSPVEAFGHRLLEAPCDLVFDHFASVDPARGVDQPSVATLMDLLAGGRCWVKLSGAYRLSTRPPPYADMIPLAERLSEVRPDRLLWASDWPHVAFAGETPADVDLLDALLAWLPSPALRDAVLATNPAVLYGFDTR